MDGNKERRKLSPAAKTFLHSPPLPVLSSHLYSYGQTFFFLLLLTMISVYISSDGIIIVKKLNGRYVYVENIGQVSLQSVCTHRKLLG